MYREKFRRRLPESLDELRGPTRGVVELPLHMAWSGMTSYDLGKPRQRMGLYRTVLHEGLHDDLPRYLNQDLLLHLWPVLRTLVGRTVRAVWEDAFPQLASRTRAAA
ncbi:transcriptional regulator [Streptomyces scabiei]|uniref:transcriptional regulator n=1 Tax=Streptomyces scabiei TaxID=1930 RepID=UPI001F22E463|nr:transcriptional regulator [Streptomyces scabiei]